MPLGNVVVVMVGGIIATFMIMDNDFVSLPALLVALTVKLNVPAAVGVPEIIPVVESAKPVGRLPLDIDHVMGAVPVAVSGWLYDVPTVPLGNVVVVMTGATAEVPIVIDNAFVSLPALLVAFTVKLNVPIAVGVPEIVPPEYSVSPFGRLPLANDHVKGAVPVASSGALYAVPVFPSGSVAVVMAGATAEEVTVIDNTFVSLPTLLVAFTVKLKSPAVVGVPDITPSAESVTSLGKLPLSNDHVMGAVPVAVSVWL
jgi:hypothetical protein